MTPVRTAWLFIFIISLNLVLSAPAKEKKKQKCKGLVVTPSEQSCLLGHMLQVLTQLINNQKNPICLKDVKEVRSKKDTSKQTQEDKEPHADESNGYYTSDYSEYSGEVSDNSDESSTVWTKSASYEDKIDDLLETVNKVSKFNSNLNSGNHILQPPTKSPDLTTIDQETTTSSTEVPPMTEGITVTTAKPLIVSELPYTTTTEATSTLITTAVPTPPTIEFTKNFETSVDELTTTDYESTTTEYSESLETSTSIPTEFTESTTTDWSQTEEDFDSITTNMPETDFKITTTDYSEFWETSMTPTEEYPTTGFTESTAIPYSQRTEDLDAMTTKIAEITDSEITTTEPSEFWETKEIPIKEYLTSVEFTESTTPIWSQETEDFDSTTTILETTDAEITTTEPSEFWETSETPTEEYSTSIEVTESTTPVWSQEIEDFDSITTMLETADAEITTTEPSDFFETTVTTTEDYIDLDLASTDIPETSTFNPTTTEYLESLEFTESPEYSEPLESLDFTPEFNKPTISQATEDLDSNTTNIPETTHIEPSVTPQLQEKPTPSPLPESSSIDFLPTTGISTEENLTIKDSLQSVEGEESENSNCPGPEVYFLPIIKVNKHELLSASKLVDYLKNLFNSPSTKDC